VAIYIYVYKYNILGIYKLIGHGATTRRRRQRGREDGDDDNGHIIHIYIFMFNTTSLGIYDNNNNNNNTLITGAGGEAGAPRCGLVRRVWKRSRGVNEHTTSGTLHTRLYIIIIIIIYNTHSTHVCTLGGG